MLDVMTSLSDMNQERWAAVCKRLGLIVDVSKGKGSHMRIYSAEPEKEYPPLTIPNHLNPITNKKIMKNLRNLGYTEAQVRKAMK